MSAEVETPAERLARAMLEAGYVNRTGGPNVYALARDLNKADGTKTRDSWDRQLRNYLVGTNQMGADNADAIGALLNVEGNWLRRSVELPTREAVLLADRLEALVARAEAVADRLEARPGER